MNAEERTHFYPSRHEFTIRVLLTVGILLAILILLSLAWYLVEVLLLIFGGVLLAILLRTAALPFSRYMRLSMTGSVAVVIVLLLGAGSIFVFSIAPILAEQTNNLMEELPVTAEHVKQGFIRHIPLPEGFGSAFQVDWQQMAGSVLKRVVSILSLSFGVIGNLVIILFFGIYLAFSPAPYLNGVVRLVPVSRRDTASKILVRLGSVLRWWLAGQIAAMAFVGTLVALGVWIIGISPALILGVTAGILEFIPYIGPTLGFLPILMLAAPLGLKTVLYVLALYLVIQSLESYVINPLIQKKAVELPPVLTLMSQVILALLVGFIGLLFATPLMACIMVLVNMIYVKGILEGRKVVTDEKAGEGM